MPITGPPLDGPIAVHEILRAGLESKPDAEALVSRRQRWSFRTLDDLSNGLAAGYLGLGLRPGDRIASLMPNRVELLVHYVACMKCGLVAMPLNYRYMAPEIDHALGVGGAAVLLAHDERRADLEASALASRLPLGRIGYADDGGGGEPSFGSLVDSPPRPALTAAEARGRGDPVLHLGQHRPAQGGLPQLRDARLDPRQRRRELRRGPR